MSGTGLNRRQMVDALHRLGLAEGDSVIVHSSFRALGAVEGGAAAVIEALLEAIGPAGNLMLPTFNYSKPLPEPCYDPRTTPGRTGIIPEIGRQRPDAVRSLHPTHSVAVIGPRAGELTEGHLSGRAMGLGSPIDRLVPLAGKVLLIGVGQTANSTLHVAEERAGRPKISAHGAHRIAHVRLPDGHIIEHTLDPSPSCSVGFEAAAYPLRQAGAIHDGRVGAALTQLMRGREVIDIVAALLRREPAALLCTNPDCIGCTWTRTQIA